MRLTAALVTLAYVVLMYVQINHLQMFFFGPRVMAYLMATAVIIGCSFGYSAVGTLWIYNHKAWAIASLSLVCFFMGSWMSIKASEAVFEANQNDRTEWRSLGVAGQATRNEVIRAGHAVQQMQSAGVLDPAALEQAVQRQRRAIEAHEVQMAKASTGTEDDKPEESKGLDPFVMALALEMIGHGLCLVLFLMSASRVKSVMDGFEFSSGTAPGKSRGVYLLTMGEQNRKRSPIPKVIASLPYQ